MLVEPEPLYSKRDTCCRRACPEDRRTASSLRNTGRIAYPCIAAVSSDTRDRCPRHRTKRHPDNYDLGRQGPFRDGPASTHRILRRQVWCGGRSPRLARTPAASAGRVATLDGDV